MPIQSAEVLVVGYFETQVTSFSLRHPKHIPSSRLKSPVKPSHTIIAPFKDLLSGDGATNSRANGKNLGY